MTLKDRLFIGVFPAGLSYADRGREVCGDYAKLAFLDYDSLTLTFAADCPQQFRPMITADAATIQARRGELFQVSTCGQTIRLGGQGGAR